MPSTLKRITISYVTILTIILSTAHAESLGNSSHLFKLSQESMVQLAQAEDLAGSPLNENKQPEPDNEPTKELLPMFPFMKERAAEVGEKLPLSFGVSLVYLNIQRDIDVKDISIGLNPGNLQPVNDLISFDVGVDVETLTTRFDLWLFPFLNVYALLGRLENESDVLFSITTRNDLNLPNPNPPPLFNTVPAGTTITAPLSGTMDGLVYGGGITLAAGYNRFFLTLDNNYTYAEPGSELDYTIATLMSSVRTGYRDKWKNYEWRLWFGGARWDTDRNLDGYITVDVGGTPQNLYFKVDQEPVTKENYTLGGNLEFNPHFNILFEYGFKDDMESYMFGVNARF